LNSGAEVNENEEIELQEIPNSLMMNRVMIQFRHSKYLGFWIISDEFNTLVMAFRITKKN